MMRNAPFLDTKISICTFGVNLDTNLKSLLVQFILQTFALTTEDIKNSDCNHSLFQRKNITGKQCDCTCTDDIMSSNEILGC